MNQRPSSKILKIALLLSAKSEYGRGVLRGIANHAKDHPHWQFRVEDPNRAGVSAIVKWKPDGIVMMLHRSREVEPVFALAKPLVTVCKLTGISDAELVQSDDIAVGRLGAEHLLEREAATYGFVGLIEGEFVEVRGRSFKDTIERAGKPCVLYRFGGMRSTDQVRLRNWLKKLPKPLALMTSNDVCGRFVLESCRHAGLQVPEEVAVLGVDNEEPLSQLVWPGLSSIALATDLIGRQAAILLGKMLTGRATFRSPIFIPPLGVVVRGSTQRLELTDPDLAKVVAAIHASTAQALSVEDLLEMVPISRTSLEKRFRLWIGRTPKQEIRRARIAQARHLLLATNLPLKAIAERCGYAAQERLIEAFRQETDLTPTEFRKNGDRSRQPAGSFASYKNIKN